MDKRQIKRALDETSSERPWALRKDAEVPSCEDVVLHTGIWATDVGRRIVEVWFWFWPPEISLQPLSKRASPGMTITLLTHYFFPLHIVMLPTCPSSVSFRPCRDETSLPCVSSTFSLLSAGILPYAHYYVQLN